MDEIWRPITTQETKVKNIYNQKDDESFKPKMPENLVFAGGGIKGLAHLGVLKYLVEGGYDEAERDKRRGMKLSELGIKGAAGTSAGSLISLIVAMDLTYAQIEKLLKSEKLKWSEIFKKYDLIQKLWKKIKKTYGFAVFSLVDLAKNVIEWIIQKYGADGVNLQKFVDTVISECRKYHGIEEKDFTFEKLYAKTGIELTVVITELETGQARYLNHINTPKFNVALAVRTSMNIPIAFQPVKLDLFFDKDGHKQIDTDPEYKKRQDKRKEIRKRKGKKEEDLKPTEKLTYVDGGLVDNFPIDYFDQKDIEGHKRNRKTLGSFLYQYDAPIETLPTEKLNRLQVGNDFTELRIDKQVKALFGVTFEASSSVCMHKEIKDQRADNFYRVVRVCTENISTFELAKGDDPEVRERLIGMGFKGAKQLLEERIYQR